MNPVTFLAIASLESSGNYSQVNNTGPIPTYGIVQISPGMLNAFNCANGYHYTTSDLIGQGSLCHTPGAAVELGFDVLGQFMITMNQWTNSFKLTASSWNGAPSACGRYGSLAYPFGTACGGFPVASGTNCYGEAAYKIASSYSPYWIDPSTNQPNSYYFGTLSAVSPCNNQDIITVYHG